MTSRDYLSIDIRHMSQREMDEHVVFFNGGPICSVDLVSADERTGLLEIYKYVPTAEGVLIRLNLKEYEVQVGESDHNNRVTEYWKGFVQIQKKPKPKDD